MGGSWGLAIVGLTVLVRAILVPLTFRQLKSMQEMQRLAPQINAIKEKYKEDKQRQQQEIDEVLQGEQNQPFASCLPCVLQLPVFISLFYMLRTDLKFDICGPQLREYYNARTARPDHREQPDPRTAPSHVVGKTVEGLTETGCNVVIPARRSSCSSRTSPPRRRAWSWWC